MQVKWRTLHIRVTSMGMTLWCEGSLLEMVFVLIRTWETSPVWQSSNQTNSSIVFMADRLTLSFFNQKVNIANENSPFVREVFFSWRRQRINLPSCKKIYANYITIHHITSHAINTILLLTHSHKIPAYFSWPSIHATSLKLPRKTA